MPPARPSFLTLPNQLINWGLSIQICVPIGASHSHSNHHTWTVGRPQSLDFKDLALDHNSDTFIGKRLLAMCKLEVIICLSHHETQTSGAQVRKAIWIFFFWVLKPCNSKNCWRFSGWCIGLFLWEGQWWGWASLLVVFVSGIPTSTAQCYQILDTELGVVINSLVGIVELV